MFSASKFARSARISLRAFSTTTSRSADLAKLVLIGRLGRDPEVRKTRSDKEYITYTVATTNYPPPPPNPDGTRGESKTTWHTIYSFNQGSNNYLRHLQKGSHVYVEANYELRDADPSAESGTQAQKSVFLRHETIRLLKAAQNPNSSSEEEE